MPDLTAAADALNALKSVATKARDTGYSRIRNSYMRALNDAAQTVLDGGNRRAAENSAKRAAAEAYSAAGLAGYQAGAGKDAEPEPDDDAVITAEQNAEQGHISNLFDALVEQRKAKDSKLPRDRIELYGASLDGLYNHLKLRGAGNKMLTFGGEDGAESCATCQRLKGQRHRAKWWTQHDLVPYPGNPNFECGGWLCQHGLFDDDGEAFTR